jgi:hypothetical protein
MGLVDRVLPDDRVKKIAVLGHAAAGHGSQIAFRVDQCIAVLVAGRLHVFRYQDLQS